MQPTQPNKRKLGAETCQPNTGDSKKAQRVDTRDPQAPDPLPIPPLELESQGEQTSPPRLQDDKGPAPAEAEAPTEAQTEVQQQPASERYPFAAMAERDGELVVVRSDDPGLRVDDIQHDVVCFVFRTPTHAALALVTDRGHDHLDVALEAHDLSFTELAGQTAEPEICMVYSVTEMRRAGESQSFIEDHLDNLQRFALLREIPILEAPSGSLFVPAVVSEPLDLFR